MRFADSGAIVEAVCWNGIASAGVRQGVSALGPGATVAARAQDEDQDEVTVVTAEEIRFGESSLRACSSVFKPQLTLSARGAGPEGLTSQAPGRRIGPRPSPRRSSFVEGSAHDGG